MYQTKRSAGLIGLGHCRGPIGRGFSWRNGTETTRKASGLVRSGWTGGLGGCVRAGSVTEGQRWSIALPWVVHSLLREAGVSGRTCPVKKRFTQSRKNCKNEGGEQDVAGGETIQVCAERCCCRSWGLFVSVAALRGRGGNGGGCGGGGRRRTGRSR